MAYPFCCVHVHTPNQLPLSKRGIVIFIECIIVDIESENNRQYGLFKAYKYVASSNTANSCFIFRSLTCWQF